MRLVKELGASRFVFTSDFFSGSHPSPSDLLRMLLGVLYDAGLSAQEIRSAAADNPAALLGMSPLLA